MIIVMYLKLKGVSDNYLTLCFIYAKRVRPPVPHPPLSARYYGVVFQALLVTTPSHPVSHDEGSTVTGFTDAWGGQRGERSMENRD